MATYFYMISIGIFKVYFMIHNLYIKVKIFASKPRGGGYGGTSIEICTPCAKRVYFSQVGTLCISCFGYQKLENQKRVSELQYSTWEG